MRCYILIIGVLCVLCNDKSSTALILPDHGEPATVDIALRDNETNFSTSNVWENVKNSLMNAWNVIMISTVESIEKIRQCIYDSHLILKGEELIERVKERLDQLKEDIRKKVEELSQKSESIGEIVKKCYRKQEEDINRIVRHALEDIRKCILDNNNSIFELEQSIPNPETEEKYAEHIKKKLDLCSNDVDNIDDCLTNVKRDVHALITSPEGDYIRNEQHTKGIIDSILNKLLQCTSNGIIEASEKLYEKLIDIGRCIKEEINNQQHNHSV